MELTKFQKEIIDKIIKFKPIQTEYSLKTLIEYLLENFFKNIGIIITSEKISIFIDVNKSETLKNINKRTLVYEFIKLLEFLLDENYIECIITNNVKNSFIYGNCEKNKKEIEIPLNKNTLMKIFNNINTFFYISPLLLEYKKQSYQSIEKINLRYTLIALICSIFISALGMVVQYYIATKINTVVEFAKPDQLKQNINFYIKN